MGRSPTSAVDRASHAFSQDVGRRVVTYSHAHTLVPTYECFNRCTYCNFRADPGRSPWVDLSAVASLLPTLRQRGMCEVLVLSGEVAPQSPRRGDWFRHLYQICELALEAGLLPHTNAGPLSRDEMAQLRQVNVSMGLMVEQVTPKLLATVHRHAPSKRPEVRLQQLTWAGELGIPFTTGLLLGLGETEADWVDSLRAIATLQARYGHIQEVILQPHSPGQRQPQPEPGKHRDRLDRRQHQRRAERAGHERPGARRRDERCQCTGPETACRAALGGELVAGVAR